MIKLTTMTITKLDPFQTQGQPCWVSFYSAAQLIEQQQWREGNPVCRYCGRGNEVCSCE